MRNQKGMTYQSDPLPGLFAVIQQILHLARIDTRHTQHQLTRDTQSRRSFILFENGLYRTSADAFVAQCNSIKAG